MAEDPLLGLGALGEPQWRAGAERAQERALPGGHSVVTCSARLGGSGGLGHHLGEIMGALQRRGEQASCICGADGASGSPSVGRRLRARALDALLSPPPLRLAGGQRALDQSVEFDRRAARQLPPADHLIAFNGQALEQMRIARSRGYESVSIVAANSHYRRVVGQHAKAHRQYPIEGSFAGRLLKRNLLEYAQADRIYVASEYTRESFLQEGFAEETLARFPLTPDLRYTPAARAPESPTFDIVYVGALSVAKGVPLLVDAVRALDHPDLRLILVGGWKSRGMRSFLEHAFAQDPRLRAAPGDPLNVLRTARLCVHPAYEDGFAYAPAESLACGVPVIVSEDTGMKELIRRDGADGVVVGTGDLQALTAAIDAAYRGEILAWRAPRRDGLSPPDGVAEGGAAACA